MDLDAILRLMDRAEKSSFTRVEYQLADQRILLERGAAPAAAAPLQAQESTLIPAQEPGAEPFVQAGKPVEKGDTLCIIEAMKTMNEIRSPRSGVVSAILPGDAATVSAGDTLFLLSEGM
jgi:biotin carboxyl carrier protein